MSLKIKLFLFFYCLVFSVTSLSAQETDAVHPLVQKLNTDHVTAQQKAQILDSLMRYFHSQEDYSKGIKYSLQALNLHREQNDDSLTAYYNERLGLMFYRLGNYDVSSKYFLAALKLFDNTDNQKMQAQITGNLANVYTRLENYDKAINYLLQAKTIFEADPETNDKNLSGLYTNIGLAYAGASKNDSAIFYYKKALKIVEGGDYKLIEASVYNNLGEVYFALHDYDRALREYKDAYALFGAISNQNGMGTSLSNIAKVKIENEAYDEAIDLCYRSIKHLKKINADYFLMDVQKLLSEAFEGLGKYKASLRHKKQYVAMKDSILGSNTQEYIANLEMKYKTQKEQQKYQLLQQKSKLAKTRHNIEQLRLYIVIGGVFVLLVITILIIFNMRRRLQHNKLKQRVLNQEQEALQNNLTFKQKEIENFAIHIQEKNSLLNRLQDEIKDIRKKNTEKDAHIDLKPLTQIIQNSLYVDENRKELELKIDHAHQEFLHRLKTQFPDLSKTETRLCSLLLLEFSSKEIATIMNIEPSSVKTSRNRLRKKLSLPANSDISTFLSKI